MHPYLRQTSGWVSNKKTPNNIYKRPIYKRPLFYIIIFLLAAAGIFIYWSISKSPAEKTVETDQEITTAESEPMVNIKLQSYEGSISYKENAQGEWGNISPSTMLTQGSSLKTAQDSKAVLISNDNTITRLDQNTELRILEINPTNIILELIDGQAYCRVNSESISVFQLETLGSSLTALGTGFNVKTDKENQNYELLVIEDKVRVKINKDNELIAMRTIASGQEFTVDLKEEDKKEMIKTEDYESADLDNDWFSWNKQEDEKNGFDLGIMSEPVFLKITEPENKAELDEEKVTIKGNVDKEAKLIIDGKEVDHKDGSFEYELTLKEGENEIEIKALKEELKTEKILTLNYNSETGSISLSAKTDKKDVSLSWEADDLEEGYTGFKIVRGSEPTPSYPGDDYHLKSSLEANSDTWKDLENGTHYFRVCAYKEDSCGKYSNSVEVEISEHIDEPNGYITLSGKYENGSVQLSWETKDLYAEDGFKTLVSEKPEPSYPGSTYHLRQSPDTRSDSWTDLSAGTYYFRVCEFEDNACNRYSNEITVEVKDDEEEKEDKESEQEEEQDKENDNTNSSQKEDNNQEEAEEEQTTGIISLNGSANAGQAFLSWSAKYFNADQGFYTFMSTSGAPNFPGEQKNYLNNPQATFDTWSKLEKGQTYYFRVCQAVGTGCGVTSNSITITITE